MTQTPTDALRLATRFHETYERLAPSFGYETRKDAKKFDPETPNGRLMVAVCSELAAAPASPLQGGGDEALIAELKEAKTLLSKARGDLYIDRNGIDMLDQINAFFARNGKGEG